MRLPSWFLLIMVFFAVIVTAGAALFTYTNVRQFTAEAPIALPTLGGLGSFVQAPTAVSLFAPTTPSTSVPLLATSAPTTASTIPVNAAPTSAPAGTSAGVTPVAPAASVTSAPGAAAAPLDPGRVTILLLGIDQRKGEKGPFRTDTMMVISINPLRKTAVLLSIPRDIYITIPGYGPNRINTAEGTGEINDYPGGGPRLAANTVETLIGVPIQHYFLINFDVFDAAIDAIGPIQVCPTTAIHDTNYPDGNYGIITADFPAGCQQLDSTKLLQYARVRHNAGDDFGRAQRQQEVVKAVRERVLSLGGVSALLGKAGPLWDTVKTSVKTDMTFDEMVSLAQIGLSIPKENILSTVLSSQGNYLIPSKTDTGDEVLSPVYEKIQDLVAQMFDAPPGSAANAALAGGTAPAAAPNATESAATILVSNGAGIDGLGKQIVQKLRGQSFTVLDPKNADLPGGYAQTVIRVYTGKVQAARAIAQALGLDGGVITTATGGPSGVDIEVVVGKDLVVPATKAA